MTRVAGKWEARAAETPSYRSGLTGFGGPWNPAVCSGRVLLDVLSGRMLPEAAMTKLGHSLLTTARVGALLPADVPEGRMGGVVVGRDGRWLGSDGDR